MRLTDEQREWLALTLVPGIGTALFIRLLARFRTPGNVLRTPAASLAEVVGWPLAQRVAQYGDTADVAGQEKAMERYGAGLITLEDSAYPIRLAEVFDPPLALFVRGELREEDEFCMAVVGTRRPTPYGLHIAQMFGRDLASRGITVVSGLAAGIDGAAHRGAIEAGGRTIAVLGCGVDVVYPQQHAELMESIAQYGCVVSQFPMGTGPSGGHFPIRNRIISGLSMGVLVVEAPAESGALITARHAGEQGREVFAVPGPVNSRTSCGPHALIREGAKLVENVDDILVELNLPPRFRRPAENASAPIEQAPKSAVPRDAAPQPVIPQRAASPQPMATQTAPPPAQQVPGPTPPSAIEKQVLSSLSPNGSHVDEIASACRISVSDALSSLTLLELKGLVKQFSGKRFAPR